MNLLTHFTTRLDEKSPDLALSEQTWDRRAAEVSQFTVDEHDPAMHTIHRHMALQGANVLEISFGGGRHLLEFLRAGARVSGIEISANMVAQTHKKLKQNGFPLSTAQLVQSSWEAVQLDAHEWHEAFDLVFLYMSPAISGTAMLQKALDACRGALYMVLYSYREDSLLTELQELFGLPLRSPGSQGADDIYTIFNILYQWGYFPELRFEQRSKTNKHDPLYILERYASWLWRGEDSPSDRERLLDVLQAKARNGKVSTVSRDIVGHLYTDKRIRR